MYLVDYDKQVYRLDSIRRFRAGDLVVWDGVGWTGARPLVSAAPRDSLDGEGATLVFRCSLGLVEGVDARLPGAYLVDDDGGVFWIRFCVDSWSVGDLVLWPDSVSGRPRAVRVVEGMPLGGAWTFVLGHERHGVFVSVEDMRGAMASRFMLQGVLYYQQFRRCGKPNCACSHDDSQRHGPYWYARDVSGLVRYVGRELPDAVVWAANECQRMHETMIEVQRQARQTAAAAGRLARGQALENGDVEILRRLGFSSCLVQDYQGQAVDADFQPAMLPGVDGYHVPRN